MQFSKGKRQFVLSILLVLLVSFSAFTTSDEKGTYVYVDGNNNEYTITPALLVYEPIQPAESSSGEYSGGEGKSMEINAEQYSTLKTIIKSIIKDKKNHLDTRLMGCGTIVINKKSLFFNSTSPLKTELETKLRDFLK